MAGRLDESRIDCIGVPARSVVDCAGTCYRPVSRQHAVRIAVIGSGISGLGAAYVLSRAHHVELFEREPRLGGHAHTHDIAVAGGVQPLDTGFLVFNERTYPNFVTLLDQLGVASHASDMCFGVRCRRCGLEYASQSISSLLAILSGLLLKKQ